MKNFLQKQRQKVTRCVQAFGTAVMSLFMFGFMAVPAYASSGGEGGEAGTLADTLSTFSDVFAWFLEEGGNLLSWMLDKPIILLSLAIFFCGAVVGMLSRVYNSF